MTRADRIIALRRQNMSIDEIAAAVKIGRYTVCKVIREGVPPDERKRIELTVKMRKMRKVKEVPTFDETFRRVFCEAW
jgi:transposase